MRPIFLIGVLALTVTMTSAPPVSAETAKGASTQELVAQTRPRVVIRPSRSALGPNSKRQCRATLVQEFRVSGTVIVPRMHCWWE